MVNIRHFDNIPFIKYSLQSPLICLIFHIFAKLSFSYRTIEQYHEQ